jgi:DNA repair exonuclease SbcCD ATPase subunit
MRLIETKLKNFKRLADYRAEFSRGINVVKGQLNETGKSTLLKGIVAALFYDVKSVKEEVKDCFSWDSDRRCETLVEFEEKGKAYSLYKDFENGLVSFIGHNTGEKFDTPKKISGKMKELLGTDSDKFFSLTSCIYQDDVKAISSGKKEISDSLEEVVTGGKEGILASQAMKKLGDKISEMRKGLDRLAKTKGSLASLRDQRDEYLRKWTKVRDEVSEVEARKIKLMEVNEQLANVKERYENVKTLLDNNEKLKKIEESINGLRQKYGDVKKRLDGISALMTKLKEANEALSSIEGFEDELQVLEFRRRLNEIQIRRKDIENSLNKLQREVAEAEERLNKRKSLRFLSLRGSLVIAAIISIGGIIGTLIGPLYFLSLLILGMAFLAAGMWARSVLASKRTEISEWTGRLQRMNKTLGELGEEEMRILGEAKCSTIDEYDKKEKDFKYRLEEKGSLEAQLKGMLGDNKTVEDFQKQETEIATDLAVEKAGLTDDLKATALNPEKHIEKKREFQNLDAEKNRLEREKMECEITIKQAGSNIEDQIRLEEELKEFKEALEQEEKKVKIYELARDFISKARDEALSSITGILKDGIQTYFEIFTSGKYKQVEIRKDDKGDLEFWIRSDEKAGLAKPEELSGGVIDEFYLACRLALVKLIFGDKKPPLLLDDPFGNFDSVRLADTLSFLKTLANDYQIIIFTLGDSYDKIADNIILLGESVKPPTPDGR